MKLNNQISHIESLTAVLIDSLKKTEKELKEDSHLYSSSNRARFKRLRLELTKQLLETERTLYNS